jgi:hypothetical protein
MDISSRDRIVGSMYAVSFFMLIVLFAAFIF